MECRKSLSAVLGFLPFLSLILFTDIFYVSRKPDSEVPSISVHRSTPTEFTESPAPIGIDTLVEESLELPGTKTPCRGVSGSSSTLETVQETSQPSTPALGVTASKDKLEDGLKQLSLEQENPMERSFTKAMDSKAKTESGSDSGGTKGEIKMRSTTSTISATAPRTTGPPPKSYSTGGVVGRGKPSGEGSTKNMTVETETVSSIPQVAVGGTGGPGINGSLRAKPSSETIRPKKDKKKTIRKAPSVTSGAGKIQLLTTFRLLNLAVYPTAYTMTIALDLINKMLLLDPQTDHHR